MGPLRRRWPIAALSLAAHLMAIPLAMLTPETPPPPRIEPDPVIVSLAPPPRPPKPPPPEPKKKPEPAPASAPPVAPRPPRVPPPPEVRPLVSAVTPLPGLSDGQLVGARMAGAGSGEGDGLGCDMVWRLQKALRADPEVRAAVGQAHRASRGAVLLWNGDWIQSPGQEGKGLAGVRQAIMMEVAFSPSDCRSETLRGLVVISMNDGAKLAMGAGSWRWGDLLTRQRH